MITIIEPEEHAPVGRLGQWIFAEGASTTVVHLWSGDALPSFEDLGDGLVVLGGAMSAHDEADHPWLPGLRALLRRVVDERLPAVAVCLGAQVAAEALGGATAVPSPHGAEGGIVELELTDAAADDPVFGAIVAEAVRAAVRAGVPTSDGTRLPVIVSHEDGVVRLPAEATLLASSAGAPVQAWRAGRLLALQHHPESTPERIEYWQARRTARELGVDVAAPTGAVVRFGLRAVPAVELPEEAVEAGRAARAEAERVDPVVQAFGRALARHLVASARAQRAHRVRRALEATRAA